mgnify:FL=1
MMIKTGSLLYDNTVIDYIETLAAAIVSDTLAPLPVTNVRTEYHKIYEFIAPYEVTEFYFQEDINKDTYTLAFELCGFKVCLRCQGVITHITVKHAVSHMLDTLLKSMTKTYEIEGYILSTTRL